VRKWLLLGLGAAILAAAAAFALRESSSEPEVAIGAWEYFIRDPDPAAATKKFEEVTAAGLKEVITNSFWAPGQREPTPEEVRDLRNGADAAEEAGVKPLVIVQNVGSRTTPRTPALRAQFAEYAASLARQIPGYRDFIVGNEPNLNRFWLPQFGPNGENVAARDYLALLAET
jgi:sugar phosphate isomerase/epimerase